MFQEGLQKRIVPHRQLLAVESHSSDRQLMGKQGPQCRFHTCEGESMADILTQGRLELAVAWKRTLATSS